MITLTRIKAMTASEQLIALRCAVGRASRAKTDAFRREALADFWYLRRFNTNDRLDYRMRHIEAGHGDPIVAAYHVEFAMRETLAAADAAFVADGIPERTAPPILAEVATAKPTSVDETFADEAADFIDYAQAHESDAMTKADERVLCTA